MKYVRMRIFTDCIFPYKDGVSVFIQENTGQRKSVFRHTSHNINADKVDEIKGVVQHGLVLKNFPNLSTE